MTRVVVPAVIVILAVVGFLGAAGWNASGEPRLVMTLTERELQLPYRTAPPDEDPGVQLRLAYQHRLDPLDTLNWLPESRLREIGFDLDVAAGTPQAAYAYDHVPPRLAWVVFEYDGPRWRAMERQLQTTNEPRAGSAASASRLVPVDAGADVDALLVRYPSGHLIMRAVIGLRYASAEEGGPLLHGVLREVVPRHIAVPHRFRALVDGLSTQPASIDAPRYVVDLALGALGLPYIRAMRLAEPNLE